MKILRKVNVCGQAYAVILKSPAEDEELEHLHGYCNYNRSEIILNTEYSVESMRVTLFHEIVHAALNAMGLDVKLEALEPGLEESVVQCITAALRPALKSCSWKEPILKKVTK